MTDVFISYTRDDQAMAQRFAKAFEAHGLLVWWDATLHSGDAYDQVTEEALRTSKAVVVLWSKKSVASRWVRAEATLANRSRTLVPVRIEACDLPIMFELTHTADLAHWTGAADDAVWRTFLADVLRFVKANATAKDLELSASSAALAESTPPPAAPIPRRHWSKRPAVLAAIGAALLVGIGLLAYWQLGTSHATPTARPAGVAGAPAAGSISVAVLPFDNLSGDANQKFFSDGITEEITAVLARVAGLKVVARTSAFQFKAQNRDIQSIGQQLHATHYIEGSVQKAGDQVKITAQLIKADDGTHLWAESYNRELKDIFAIQEEIAKAIAGALRVPLGLKTLVANQTQDPESYQQYLRAKALVRMRGFDAETDAAVRLEQVVARDPDFAPAWALLANAYAYTPITDPALRLVADEVNRRSSEIYWSKAEAAARQAIKLDPNDAKGYEALGFVQLNRGHILAAMENLSKALALDPQNPDILNTYSGMLAAVGRIKEALVFRLQLQALEPFVPAFNASTAVVLWLNGQGDAAISLMRPIASTNAWGFKLMLAPIYASMGRFGEAADTVQGFPPEAFGPGAVETAVRLLRAAPAPAQSPQTLPPLGELSWVFRYAGVPERTLEGLERSIARGSFTAALPNIYWHPTYAALRRTEHFKSYVRKLGLVEYWRAKGWPEFCQPVGKDDFACH